MKTFAFALAMSLICSILLAGVSHFWQPLYQENQALERKSQTLSVLGLEVPEDREATLKKYDQLVEETEAGNKPAYLYRDPESGQVKAVAFPVDGKGLWGPIRGMAALSGDLKTIQGVRFFDQQETPGLGAEISKDWFQEQFEGKPATGPDGKVQIEVVGANAADSPYEVDGISGATITGDGVTELMQRELARFLENYKPGKGKR